MTITYKNDIADYKSFLYYTAFIEERKIRNIIIFGAISVALFIAGFVFAMVRMSKAGSLFVYISVGMLALTLFLLYKVIAAVKRSIKKMPKVAPDFLSITNTYEFNENTFTVTSKNANRKKKQTTELEYSAILKGVERKDIVYLYLYPNVALMYKKSNYDGDGDLTEFLKNKLGEKFKCKKARKQSTK